MSASGYDYHTIREYLLGELAAAVREEFEQTYFTDDELFKELQAAEDDLIDDFLTGDLSEAEVARFHQHFLVGAERKQKLRVIRSYRRYAIRHAGEKQLKKSELVRVSPWQQLFSSPIVRITALAAVILIAAVGIWRVYFFQSDVDRGLLALNAAYRQQRPLESRITQLSYAPFVTTRGPSDSNVNRAELRTAELILLNTKPTPASRHALGKVYLAQKRFDEATGLFEEALKGDPNNAQIHADLGAAHLEQGKTVSAESNSDNSASQGGKSLESMARSLEHLNKALALAPQLSEALFNRALCYQAMKLWPQAEADWLEYLKQDASGPWSGEARKNLELLKQQRIKSTQQKDQLPDRFLAAYRTQDDPGAWGIIGQSYSSAGNGITNALASSYLALKNEGRDDEARNKLEVLVYAGQLARRLGGDRYVSDIASFYSLASPAKRVVLAQARAAMERGYQLFTESRFNEAIVVYSEAKQLFERIGNLAEATFAAYRIGHCYLLQPDLHKSSRIFEQLLSFAQAKHYQWLLAQCYYGSANIRIDFSEYSKAIDHSSEALELSAQLNDTNGVVKTLIQLADEYRALNDREKSLDLVHRSLNSIGDSFVEPMQAWGPFIAISLNLNSFNLHAAALEYQKEALRLALDMARPLIISRSYVYLGSTYAKLKNYEEATRNIQLAIQTGRQLTNEPNGLEMVANASVQLGELYREKGDHGKAIAAFDQSLTMYDTLSFQYFAFAAHKGKLLSFTSQRDDAAASQEIQIVLDMFQKFRSGITGQRQRNTFFDSEQRIYELAIDFEYSRKNNPQRAFEYAESSRARSLRDAMRRHGEIVGRESGTELNHPAASKPPTLFEIQRDLPPRSQILEYSILSDKVLIWVVTNNELRTVQVPITEAALNQKTQNYLNSLQPGSGNNAETLRAAKELYDILVKPVEAFIVKDSLLCIVSDKILNYLPYEALVSSISGRYLLEDYQLQRAPSAGAFIDCSKIANDKGGVREERLLSVGNPTFDRKMWPALSDLPSAAREAETVAQAYLSPSLLLGSRGTPRQIKSEIVRSDVAHFAVHFVVDQRSEMLSELILAREPARGNGNETSRGVLRSYEIYNMKLPQTRLVVLSGCQTGVEQHYKGEGAVGLAHPFLGARVPLIVASLWAVDTESTAELMIAFHKGRRARLPTVEALRQAQLHMLRGPNERYRQPFYWASFVTIGGRADF